MGGWKRAIYSRISASCNKGPFGLLRISGSEPPEKLLLRGFHRMEPEPRAQNVGPAAEIRPFLPGPKPKIEDHIHPQGKSAGGRLPHDLFNSLMPFAVAGLLRVLAEKTDLPFIRRQA